ncbi:phage portal protein, partial [Escherichia coli]|nr:phage portal protein [Escherichia coli]
MAEWLPPSQSADAALLPALRLGNARADDLVRNNGIAANAVALHKDHIVGHMFLISYRPNWRWLGMRETAAKSFVDEVEAAWSEYAEGMFGEIDVEGKRTFTEFIREGVGVHAFNGEIFVQPVWDTESTQLFRTRFKAVSPKRVDTPGHGMGNRFLRAGVEVDRYGRAVAYHICEDDFPFSGSGRWERIPRELPTGRPAMLHIFEPVEDGQTRGANQFYSVMERLKMLDSLQATQLQSAIVKAMYPNTAIVGLQVDAEQFGGQQMVVNYHIRGRIIQVPSNYDPEKRTYSGIWDGSLKPAYSNNPAWCLWDMLTHPRYGMGKRLGASDVDKWALYAIGQYCDQTVPDGFGGTEPRMTFNAYLSQQRKVWDVLGDFCSAMRCMPVWNGQTLTFVQDRPSDVVWPYTNSDVVVDDNGVGFRYSFSALKDRHTAVEVNYTDPQNGWQTSTELVEDPDAILRYGRNLLKMDAFGCTSRGQAHRAGLWVIKTELLETQTVDFTLGSQGLRHTPGDIIEICDNDYAGTLTGGRILSIDAASRTLTLDREVTLPETGTSTVNLINGSGKPVRVDITAHPAPDRIQVSVLPDGVETYGVWGLSLPSLRRRLFRCVSIRENTDGTFAITAVQHVPEKEAIVDNGARFEPMSGSLNSVIPPAVQHLTVEVSASDGQYLALAKWDTPRVVKGVRFSLRLTSGSGENSRLVTS